jgi:hypothetical protein
MAGPRLFTDEEEEEIIAGHRYRSEVSLPKLFIRPEEEVPAQLEAKTA